MARPEPLILAAGASLALDGDCWVVESVAAHEGKAVLVKGDSRRTVSLRLLMSGEAHPASLALPELVQVPVMQDLSAQQHELLALRFAHVMEAETGYQSGDALRARACEPLPQYDPRLTTVLQRRRSKAAEMAALPPEFLRALGFRGTSERTLRRLAGRCRQMGMLGCLPGSWVRRSPGPQVDAQIREAIMAVWQETQHRSRISMTTRQRLVAQYVAESFGGTVKPPKYHTLRRIWRQWFGPGGARQRYVRSGNRPMSGKHVVVSRPGQIVALDTTVLPVKVRETVFSQPVSACLTLGLDVYTHSLVAFRLTLVSDTAVDVAMLLRDIMMPLPMRQGWGPEMAWPYPGIPESVVTEFAGFPVAGLPFFTPETITTDHGSVYKNHHIIAIERQVGTNVLPARVLRPTDKQAVERAFGSIRSLLFEMLPGYTGIDSADAGADPAGDAVFGLDELEHLIATWVVSIWQNRVLGDHSPSWDPGGQHSPNTLFAAAMAQGGFALQIPPPDLYYAFLPVHHVTVHGQRGVKVRGLWYDGPALDPLRHSRSERGGRRAGRWIVHRDPRDARHVFFPAPGQDGVWHTLRWTGMPPEGELPAFGDARVRELLAQAREAGLRPQSDSELLPLLIGLLSAHVPVSRWPGQPSKQQRSHSREKAQGAAAQSDRNTARQPGKEEQARQMVTALDSSRKSKRLSAAAGNPVTAPARLGDSLRRRSPLLLAIEPETKAS